MSTLPSLFKQKNFITENASLLNNESKKAILSIVLLEIGEEAIMKSMNKNNIDINLDIIEDKNKLTITHIYNIVSARIENLKNPAR
jgi:hypothetical protein